MAWISYRDERAFGQLIKRNQAKWLETGKSLNKILYKVNFAKRSFILKKPPLDDRDNFTNEYLVGKHVNYLRQISPNFVFTYYQAEWNVLEFIPGVTLKEYTGSFHSLLGYIIQVILAVTVAYEQCKFTHYNLHRSNIVLRKLPQKMLVPYHLKSGTIYIPTRRVPVLIDFGRSCTDKVAGHELSSQGVYPKPNHFHDIYYFVRAALRNGYRVQMREILSWYGVTTKYQPGKTSEISPKILTPKQLLDKFEQVFNYKIDSLNSRYPIYQIQ